jgi:hypothetical protein
MLLWAVADRGAVSGAGSGNSRLRRRPRRNAPERTARLQLACTRTVPKLPQTFSARQVSEASRSADGSGTDVRGRGGAKEQRRTERGRVIAEFVPNMAVSVARHGDRAVPDSLRDHRKRDTGLHQRRDVPVAQVVQPHLPQSRVLRSLLEAQQNSAGLTGPPSGSVKQTSSASCCVPQPGRRRAVPRSGVVGVRAGGLNLGSGLRNYPLVTRCQLGMESASQGSSVTVSVSMSTTHGRVRWFSRTRRLRPSGDHDHPSWAQVW